MSARILQHARRKRHRYLQVHVRPQIQRALLLLLLLLLLLPHHHHQPVPLLRPRVCSDGRSGGLRCADLLCEVRVMNAEDAAELKVAGRQHARQPQL